MQLLHPVMTKQNSLQPEPSANKGSILQPNMAVTETEPAFLVQPKLTIGRVDDPLEREADETAERVMRMQSPNFIQRQGLQVQRQFDDREEGEGENKELQEQQAPNEEQEVRRKPADTFVQRKQSGGVVSADIQNKIAATRGNGSTLDAGTRNFMESRFNADFSTVRVHTSGDAADLSRSLNAHAFTVGSDIYFNNGKYSPGSTDGQQLLAHELTHTVQQGASLQPKQIQRSFFGDLWEGIKSVAGTVWDGITTGASAVWNGIRAGASAVWSGITAVGRWGWDVIRSAGSWLWDFITWMPSRLWNMIRHLGRGIADVGLWIADIVSVIRGDEGLLHWLGRAVLGGATWVARFFAQVLDVAGAGELWTLVTNIIKFNTRSLNDTEKEEARKVYGNFISYWQVRIDERSLISAIGAYARSSPGMGVTTAHTINFNRPINATAGSGDMAWLIHELGHVAQYTAVGLQYLGEAVHAQATAGYDYGGGSALAGKELRDFNREQQPDILKDYYVDVLTTSSPSAFSADYVRMKDQAQRGEF